MPPPKPRVSRKQRIKASRLIKAPRLLSSGIKPDGSVYEPLPLGTSRRPDFTASIRTRRGFNPTSFTLTNGLQIVVVPNHLAPVVNQMVWYKVGSSDELKMKWASRTISNILCSVGTGSIGPGEFSKTIAAHGGNDNAFTSYDYTAFYETVSVDQLPMIMQMEADRMQNLGIAPETAVPELSVVLDERQERTDNNPEGKFMEKLRHMLLPEHPYGIPVIAEHQISILCPADDGNAIGMLRQQHMPQLFHELAFGLLSVRSCRSSRTTLNSGTASRARCRDSASGRLPFA